MLLFSGGPHSVSLLTSLHYFAGVLLFPVLLACLGFASYPTTNLRQKRERGADLFTGWGFSLLFFIPLGIIFGASLSLLSEILFAISLFMLVFFYKGEEKWLGTLFLALFSQIWVYLLIFKAGIKGWDDITHWMPNALFLWRNDSFPTADSLTFSYWPTYPQAMPLLHNFSAHFTDIFALSGGALLTWGLIASLALWLSELPEKATQGWKRIGFFFLALAFLTSFNPGYNPSFSLTGQSDEVTSLASAVLALLLSFLHAALKNREDSTRVRALTLQTSFVSVLLVTLRQANLVIFAFLLFAFLVLALRDKVFKRALRSLIFPLALSGACFLLWNFHAKENFAVTGFAIQSFDRWRFDLFPQMIKAAGSEILEKNGFFLLLFSACFYGAFAFFKRKTQTGALAFFALGAGMGQIAFVLTAYMGSSFSEAEITRAASFYRYITQVGLIASVWLWFVVRDFLEKKKVSDKKLIALFVFAALFLPTLYLIKASWLIPQNPPFVYKQEQVFLSLAKQIPAGQQSYILTKDVEEVFQPYIARSMFAVAEAETHSQTPYAKWILFDAFSNKKDLINMTEEGQKPVFYVIKPDERVRKILSEIPEKTADIKLLNFEEKTGKWQAVLKEFKPVKE